MTELTGLITHCRVALDRLTVWEEGPPTLDCPDGMRRVPRYPELRAVLEWHVKTDPPTGALEGAVRDCLRNDMSKEGLRLYRSWMRRTVRYHGCLDIDEACLTALAWWLEKEAKG